MFHPSSLFGWAISWQAMFVSVLFAAHGGPIAAVGLLGLTVAIWSQLSYGLGLGVGERPHEPALARPTSSWP